MPQIRTNLDPKQGSFTQVKINTSVFISSSQAPQVLTLNQGAKRNRGKILFINISVGLFIDIQTHPSAFQHAVFHGFYSMTSKDLTCKPWYASARKHMKALTSCRPNYSHPFVSGKSQGNITSCSLPSS